MIRMHLTGWARNLEILSALGPVSDWTTAVLDQAVLYFADTREPFGMNDIRLLVPEGECKNAGLYFHALLSHGAFDDGEPQLLRKVGEVVSINAKARGKKVNTYLLTAAGRKFLEERKAARIEQRKAAAA